jgi:tryptophan synthase alpha chain
VEARLAELRTLTSRPLAVGFGLSDPQSLQAIRDLGATPVIGSALVAELAEGLRLRELLEARLPQEV